MSSQTRERIVDAAAEVMRTLGLGAATTKEIARAAGYSEATLYKHFASKEDLFLEVLRTRLPPLVEVLADLPRQVASGDLQGTLERVARQAFDFFMQGIPITASVFSAPALLARHRDRVHEQDAGPHVPMELLTDYLRAEQHAGHLHREASASAAATLLMGACFQQAFLATFSGAAPSADERDQLVADLVSTLLDGIAPH